MHIFYFFLYLCRMEEKKQITFNSKQQLYQHISELFIKYIKDQGLTSKDITPIKHIISRRQYFYIKNIGKGKDAPDVGKDKFNELLKLLNLELETNIFYNLSAF